MTIVKRAPNCTYVKAEGSQGRWGEFASTTLDDVWGRLERFHQDRQGVNSDELDELAERIVTQQTTQTAGRVVQLADPTLLPWTAYEPGDTLTLNLAPKDVKGDKRVAAIVVSKGPQDAVPKYDVHFGSPVYSNDSAIVSGLRTLIREFKRPVYNPPVGATLPEIPPPQAAGYGMPTVTIAAFNASDLSKLKADLTCTGTSDYTTFNTALGMLQTKLNVLTEAISGRINLTEGDYYMGAQTVTLHIGVEFFGSGNAATFLHSKISAASNTATNVTMFAIDESAATGANMPIGFSHMDLDGHKAIQSSGSPVGIYCEPNGANTISIVDCNIHSFRGHGIHFDRSARVIFIDRCKVYSNTLSGIALGVEGHFHITNNLVYSNTEYGVLGAGDNTNLIGNRIFSNTLDGYGTGGIFNNAGTKLAIVGNHFYSNRTGIYVDGGNALITGNVSNANTTHGIHVNSVASRVFTVTGNSVYGNTQRGIYLQGVGGGTVSGNAVVSNGQHGIYVGGYHYNVNGNRVESNGLTTNNTYDGIVIITGTLKNAILNNMIRQDGSANKQRYGVNIQAGAVDTFVAGNDARGGGFVTAAFVDAGTTSVLAWAGAFGDNQP